MTNADLNFLKQLQEKVAKANTTKTFSFVIHDSWNSVKDRYDYYVSLQYNGVPRDFVNNPRWKKSHDKAVQILHELTSFIVSHGYGGYQYIY